MRGLTVIRSFISRLAASWSTPTAICAAVILGAGLVAAPVWAQEEIPPPKHAAVDANGVDLVSGGLMLDQAVNSIGGDGAAGLSASNMVRDNWSNASVDAYVQIYLSGDGTDVLTRVVVGGINEEFRNAPDQGATPIDDTRGSVGVDLNAQEIWYTSPTGLKARFNLVYFNPRGSGHVRGYLKTVTYPTGEQFTFAQGAYHQGAMTVESNLGYSLSGSYTNSRFDATTANLARLSCSGAPCDNPSQLSQGRSLTTTLTPNSVTQDTLVVTDPTGRNRTYVVDHAKHRVTSYSDGVATWTYAYSEAIDDFGTTPYDGILTVTATDPQGHVRVVKSRMNSQHIISDSDSEGRVTTYQYAQDSYLPGVGRLTQITLPEGDRDAYEFDSHLNVTAKWRIPKNAPAGAAPSTIPGATVVRAAYSCRAAVCTKPDWVVDERGNQTDYTYAPEHGGVLTATLPAGPSGIRPQTRYTYGQFTAMYVRGGVMQAAPAPVWRLIRTSTCATMAGATATAPAACVGTADETVTDYAYEPSTVPNNVRLLSTTTRSGDSAASGLATTTSYTYNDRGDVTATDGPLPGPADTTITYYDASRWKTGEVGPDPDGTGPLLYRASKLAYRADGQVSATYVGVVADQSAATFDGNFQVLSRAASDYDAQDRVIRQTTYGADGSAASQQAYAFDNLGRQICATVRMNAATFATPTGSACDLSAIGPDGNDRITYSEYDTIGRLTRITAGYKSPRARVEKVVTYTLNGQEQTVADGKGNLTTYEYDSLDRLQKVRYPNASGGGSSTSDYEAYAYDAAGNRTSWRRRSGETVTFTYDALGRAQNGLRGEVYAYDNLGRRISATYAGGVGSATYDALGRMVTETTNNLTMAYQYDLAGNRTGMTWPDNFFVSYDYDKTGAVAAIRESNGTPVAAYAYDNLGRRSLAWSGPGTPAVVHSYGYDPAGRLSSLTLDLPGTAKDQTWGLTYNAASQLVQRTASNSIYEWSAGATTTAYTVNGLNQLATAGGAAVGYDLRGNLSSNGGVTYGYDLTNNLTSTSTGAVLAYEPSGRLWQVTANAATTNFLYSGSSLVAEYANGVLLRRYVPGPNVDETPIWYEGAGVADRRWLLADIQGSVVAAVRDATGAIDTYTYDEYGAPNANNPLGRFQYTGQIWIPELGLYHYKARAYSPTLGRFLQTDPIGYGAGLNWYAYVRNNPINRRDPSGMTDLPTTVGEIVVTARENARKMNENLQREWIWRSAAFSNWSDGQRAEFDSWAYTAKEETLGCALDPGCWASFGLPIGGFGPVVAETEEVVSIGEAVATLPSGMTPAAFGRLAGFSQGQVASAGASTATTATVVSNLKAAGVTGQAVSTFQKFYAGVAAANPGNTAAVQRAALLADIMKKF